MDTDPGILCFQHCGSKVFCFHLPDRCPVCSTNLATANFQLPPFRVPYPFVRAAQHPCSIVIKPTTGDFLNDYLNCTDLHIGVTTSSGVVVEFDKDGLQRHRTSQWGQCLALDGAAGPWSEHWNTTLADIAAHDCWSAHSSKWDGVWMEPLHLSLSLHHSSSITVFRLRYNEDNFNCYTFVLTFLHNLSYGNLSKAATNRTVFCENIIVPRTTAAGKYISLYRKLNGTGCYIQKVNNMEPFPLVLS